MYDLLNNFINSKFFDKLPKYLSRRFFKIFKIFFVETKLNSLPSNNHPININESEQLAIIENFKDKFYKPFSTCSYLLEVISVYKTQKKNITLLDFGANNIDNFIYLKRYLNEFEYIYHDLPKNNSIIKELIKMKNFKNIIVIDAIEEIDNNIDFAFFGSSIHYINDYKELLKKISLKKIKHIIFSHTPFYTSKYNDKDVVMKQVNMHPIINYAYLIEYRNFLSMMDKNGYKLISQNKNTLIKFLNFKNFKNYSFLNFLDLIFVNKNIN